MFEMMCPVHVRAQIDRVAPEPVADEVVELAVLEKRMVCALVHDDGEAELSRPDDEQRQEDGEDIG